MSARVRRATAADIPSIQAFLDAHWSRGHVLAADRKLLDFQHRRADGDYNLMLAVDDAGGVLGVLGGILTSTYDPALAARDTLWLTTWKVRDDAGDAGLGLRLHRALADALPHAAIGTVGNNEAAEKIYRLLGYRTGRLGQWAMFVDEHTPPKLRRGSVCLEHGLRGEQAQGRAAERRGKLTHDPRLAVRGPDWRANRGDIDPELRLVPIDADDLGRCAIRDLGDRASRLPARSPEYFRGRYLEHPRYRYDVRALERGDDTTALVAFRCVEHDGARALRLVDVLGGPRALEGAAGVLRALLREHDAEVLDLFAHGLSSTVLASAGLTEVDPDGETIVPSHYEPFTRRNVVLRYAYRTDDGRSMILFKADADQDRPNRFDPRSDP